MNIKIIKRSAAEKNKQEIPAAENDRSIRMDVRKTTATVKIWIDDLRQKRERERLSFLELFAKEQCI